MAALVLAVAMAALAGVLLLVVIGLAVVLWRKGAAPRRKG